VKKQLNRLICMWDVDSGGPKEAQVSVCKHQSQSTNSNTGLQLTTQLLCVDFSRIFGTALRSMCSGSGRSNASGGTVRYFQTLFCLMLSSRSFRRICSFAMTFSCTAHATFLLTFPLAFKHISLPFQMYAVLKYC